MTASIILTGGTVVDGTGAPGYSANVVIEGDRIAAVPFTTERLPTAGSVIDVSGQVVCPGFIDVHSHDDIALLTSPDLDFKVSQGVTTVVTGNCGLGAAPLTHEMASELFGGTGSLNPVFGRSPVPDWSTFDEYMENLVTARPAVNVGMLVPHNIVRRFICGPHERPATSQEIKHMGDMIQTFMDAGALGLSTGLAYSPGRAAEEKELETLARIAVDAGGLYVSHIRDESDSAAEAVNEAVRVGQHAGRPPHISHVKAMGRANWGTVPELLELIDRAGATCDVYPYSAASTFLMEAFAAVGERSELSPEEVIVTYSANHPNAMGCDLKVLSESWDLDIDSVIEKLETPTPGTSVVYFAMSDADVTTALIHPNSMYGTDGCPTLDGQPHPRLFGTYPRILAKYVREEKALPLEEAVRKATSYPAEVFGVGRRGTLAPGWTADLTVFDPSTVMDCATYDSPKTPATGISLVIVAGEVVRREGRATEVRPGRVVSSTRT